MTEIEINWNKEIVDRQGKSPVLEPCSNCLEVIMETAYSGKFTRNEDNIEIIGTVDPDVETLDPQEEEAPDLYAFDVVNSSFNRFED